MRVYDPEKQPETVTAPFKNGDRVNHTSLGLGFVKDVRKTGGGNWSIYVQFDESHEKLRGMRCAPIVPSFNGRVFLEKVDDECGDVEFGTNILDLDTAIEE